MFEDDGTGKESPQLIDFGLSCKMDDVHPDIQLHKDYMMFPASHQAKSAGLRVKSLLNSLVRSQLINWSVGDDYQMFLNLLFPDDTEKPLSRSLKRSD
jgi:hypothetical protein